MIDNMLGRLPRTAVDEPYYRAARSTIGNATETSSGVISIGRLRAKMQIESCVATMFPN